VAELVPRVLEDLGIAGAALLRIVERWDEVVGPEIARHCRPVLLRGRTLEAEVDSSVWCHELQIRRGEILAALRATFADDAPAELRLRVG
jgi:predicted nucleic acid-binding Zn ribbon protein